MKISLGSRFGWRGALVLAGVVGAVLWLRPHPRPALATPPPLLYEPVIDGGESAPEAHQALRQRAHHVLIISEDGLRPDALKNLHLHWHELLRHKGSSAETALTIRQASTLPAHASMLSGVHPSVHGLTWNNWSPKRGYIKTPTIFTAAMEAGMSTAFFTGKHKLRHIVPPGSVDTYERPGYYCKKVAEDAAAYLVTEKPALAFVHFSDADELGHSQGWMSRPQLNAIAHTDACLGILYEALEKAHLLEDTLIIVSADHGGHNKTHSGAKRIDREIPWIACGPGVREDYVITEEVSTLDTAATALYALGLHIPETFAGRPRTEIFASP